MPIQKILSPNAWPGRGGHVPRFIINHGTAGGSSAAGVASWFAQTQSQVSAHYVIDRDGTIIECVDEIDAAWANGVITGPPGQAGDGIHHDAFWDTGVNPNYLTISIEHFKQSTDNSDQLTDAQQAASFQLIAEICDRWAIPRRYADAQGGITGHFSMDPVNRSRCPGNYPWEALWTHLQGAQSTQGGTDMLQATDAFASAHFTEIPGTPLRWHCKTNGFDIIGGILAYYRQCGGAFRLPLSNEIYGVLPGSASFQVFEAGVLVYDPSHAVDNPGFGPCYAMHLDANTIGLQQLMKHAGIVIPTMPTPQQIDAAASTLHAIIAGAQTILTDIGKA